MQGISDFQKVDQGFTQAPCVKKGGKQVQVFFQFAATDGDSWQKTLADVCAGGCDPVKRKG